MTNDSVVTMELDVKGQIEGKHDKSPPSRSAWVGAAKKYFELT